MVNDNIIIVIIICAICTFITRALPFIFFQKNDKLPNNVSFLSKQLPMAIMCLLILYCLRNINFQAAPYGFTEIISILIVVVIHKWKRNMILSIAGGTFVYMFLLHSI